MSQKHKIADKEALKSSTRPRSAYIEAINLEIAPPDLSDIKDAAHQLYISGTNSTLEQAYVQATLNYLYRRGHLNER